MGQIVGMLKIGHVPPPQDLPLSTLSPPPPPDPQGVRVGGGDLTAELQESYCTAESSPHSERTHLSSQTGVWEGVINF